MDLTAGEEPHVCVHAEFAADDRFHVSGPAKSGRVDHTLHPAGASPNDVELDAADYAVLGSLHGREKGIRGIHFEMLRTEAYHADRRERLLRTAIIGL
jgi:hypothetical protein